MNWSPLMGAFLVATGRPRGLARFADSPQSFLASLAPWLAFPLVGALALLLTGRVGQAVTTMLVTLVAQLAPPVLSHALARRWGREEDWLRYATAFNWCQWAIPVAGFILLIVAQVAANGGTPEAQAGNLVVLGLAAYGSWLQWTLARHGLILSRGRAFVLVLLVNAGTIALVMLPLLAQVLVSGDAANGSAG